MKLFASLLLCLCIPAALAAEAAGPKLDIGKGGQCVEDTQWMRKNHMHLLRHQRDEALRKGMRDERLSLKNCIECHSGTRKSAWLQRKTR